MAAPSGAARSAAEPSAAPPNPKILNRLRRIEGQVRGLQRMIEEGRDCHEILTQLAGVRSALDAAGAQILEVYASGCHARPGEPVTPEDLVRALRLLRG